MKDPTDLAYGSDAWHQRRAEAARANLPDWAREQYARIVAASGVDPDKFTPQAQLVLVWLARGDKPTTAGLVEILGTARSAAALAAMAEVARQAEQIVIAGQRSLDEELAELTRTHPAGDELARRRETRR